MRSRSAPTRARFLHTQAPCWGVRPVRKKRTLAHQTVQLSAPHPRISMLFSKRGGVGPGVRKKRTFLSLDTRVGGNIDLRGRGGEVVLDIGSTIRVCVFFAPDGKDSGLPAKFSFKRWFFCNLGQAWRRHVFWDVCWLLARGQRLFQSSRARFRLCIQHRVLAFFVCTPWRAPRCARAALRSFVAPVSLLRAIDRGCALVGSLPLRCPLRGLARQRHGAAPHARGIGLYRGPRRRG